MKKDIIKSYFIILSMLLMGLFAACKKLKVDNKQSPPQNSVIKQVVLTDSLGTITFYVPLRYDTSFAWVHESDCNTCHKQKYRFQPRILPIVKESGYFWKEPKDSVECVTISHQKVYFPFHDNDTVIANRIVMANHNDLKIHLESYSDLPIVFDTIQKVNDRYYSIVVMERSDSLHSKKVLAETVVRGIPLRFEYSLLTRKNDSITKNFVKNSLELINTIHIAHCHKS